MKKIKSFLIFCSSVDRDILNDCPQSEVTKYVSIGATIFFTGLLACFSGGYALFTVFHDLNYSGIISCFFALIWGLLIFNLDRYIVSSMRKKNKFWNEFKMALPRIIIAVIISLVVAKPIEVRIFNSAIETALDNKHKQAKLNNVLFSDTLYRQTEYNNYILQHSTKAEELEGKLENDPNTNEFKELKNKRDIAETDYYSTQKKYSVLITQDYNTIGRIKKERTVYQENNGVTEKYLPPDAVTEVNSLYRHIKNLNIEINLAKRNFQAFELQVSLLRKEFYNSINSKLKETTAANDSIKKIKLEVDELARIETALNDSLDRKHIVDDFINQVEMLGVITSKPFSTFWWTGCLITLLIFTIETAPIIVKLLSDKAAYDEKYETNKLKIAKLEEVTRDINDDLAENDFRNNTLLSERLDVNKTASKQAMEKLIQTVIEKSEQDKKFDNAIENLRREADSSLNGRKNGKMNYIVNAIEHFDTVSNQMMNSVKDFFKRN